MTRWNNGMLGYQAVEKHAMKVYDFYIDEDMLKKLHCYDYQTRETKFEDIYNPLKHQIISEEHFEEAFEIFCDTHDYDEIVSFLEHLEKDYQLKEIAKEVILKCSYQAAEKAHELSRVVWKLESKK